MTQSLPPNPDPRRSLTFSGLTVIVGLVLLIVACTALAVAGYLALGPMSFRRQAITRAIEEDAQASVAAVNTVDAVNTGQSSEPQSSASQSSAPQSSASQASAPQASASQAAPAVASLTELTPIEIIGSGLNAGDWHAAVVCGPQSFPQAIALRPVEDGGSTQIAFQLKGRFARLRGFAATVGGPTGESADVSQDHPRAVFRIYGDGNLLWESERLIGPGKCQPFQCNLGGVDVLTLTAESESPASLSQLAWGNPTLDVGVPGVERSEPPGA